MKIKIPTTIEVDVTHVELVLPVNYGAEEIPSDFPMREAEEWRALVNLDTRKIEGWPSNKPAELHLTVKDGGSYYLLDKSGVIHAERAWNYVPHGLVPGEYGDVVKLNIAADGTVTNWPREPDFSAFFGGDDE